MSSQQIPQALAVRLMIQRGAALGNVLWTPPEDGRPLTGHDLDAAGRDIWARIGFADSYLACPIRRPGQYVERQKPDGRWSHMDPKGSRVLYDSEAGRLLFCFSDTLNGTERAQHFIPYTLGSANEEAPR